MATESPTRLISLDVFRGMTIAGMVLVNNPGTWSAIYGPLEHAPVARHHPDRLHLSVLPFHLSESQFLSR
jgi:predicted acyltransferase